MRWKEEDINYLRKVYSTKISSKNISKALKRSIKAIRHKASRLGLSRPNIPINKPKNKNHRIEYDRKYYEKHKEKIYRNKKLRIKQYKKELIKILGGKCPICGYNKCFAAFDFHHKNGIKESTIANLLGRVSKEKVLKEAKKCILLCANCHRELHHGDMGL